MATAYVTEQVTVGRSLSTQVTVTGDYAIDITDLSVAAAAEPLVDIDVDVSKAVLVYLSSTQDVTLNTNDASTGTPTEILDLVANEPLLWRSVTGSSDYAAPPFASDITAGIYVDNNSASTATVNLLFVIDSDLS